MIQLLPIILLMPILWSRIQSMIKFILYINVKNTYKQYSGFLNILHLESMNTDVAYWWY